MNTSFLLSQKRSIVIELTREIKIVSHHLQACQHFAYQTRGIGIEKEVSLVQQWTCRWHSDEFYHEYREHSVEFRVSMLGGNSLEEPMGISFHSIRATERLLPVRRISRIGGRRSRCWVATSANGISSNACSCWMSDVCSALEENRSRQKFIAAVNYEPSIQWELLFNKKSITHLWQ